MNRIAFDSIPNWHFTTETSQIRPLCPVSLWPLTPMPVFQSKEREREREVEDRWWEREENEEDVNERKREKEGRKTAQTPLKEENKKEKKNGACFLPPRSEHH